jgi:Flagellar GTP-binding protein
VIFELVGPAGAGKTTLVRRLAAELEEVGVRTSLRHGLGWKGAEERLRREDPTMWQECCTALDAVLAHRVAQGHGSPRRLRVETHGLWFDRVLSARLARSKDVPVLFEESVLHELCRISFLLREHPDRSRLVRTLRRHVPLPDRVLVIEAPPAERVGRIAGKAARGPVNEELLRHPWDGPVWSAADREYRRLVRSTTFLRTRVHRVSNPDERSFERAARRVLELVEEALVS